MRYRYRKLTVYSSKTFGKMCGIQGHVTVVSKSYCSFSVDFTFAFQWRWQTWINKVIFWSFWLHFVLWNYMHGLTCNSCNHAEWFQNYSSGLESWSQNLFKFSCGWLQVITLSKSILLTILIWLIMWSFFSSKITKKI